MLIYYYMFFFQFHKNIGSYLVAKCLLVQVLFHTMASKLLIFIGLQAEKTSAIVIQIKRSVNEGFIKLLK